ncbi:hypothetical protein O6P43_012187 [Quillaja saponaria]|uniref:Uncharacterized protein n=1 Tax=Quillaja saponaria TaxID=32244 RepID=A0AAD7PU45_QUISA|nr:hypothetical protein O6P43_012187 [Quillaja saponaria]
MVDSNASYGLPEELKILTQMGMHFLKEILRWMLLAQKILFVRGKTSKSEISSRRAVLSTLPLRRSPSLHRRSEEIRNPSSLAKLCSPFLILAY